MRFNFGNKFYVCWILDQVHLKLYGIGHYVCFLIRASFIDLMLLTIITFKHCMNNCVEILLSISRIQVCA